jgi:hypothetical protein
LTVTNTGGYANAASAIDLNTFAPSAAGTYNPSSRIEAVDTASGDMDIFVSVVNLGQVVSSYTLHPPNIVPGASSLTGDLLGVLQVTFGQGWWQAEMVLLSLYLEQKITEVINAGGFSTSINVNTCAPQKPLQVTTCMTPGAGSNLFLPLAKNSVQRSCCVRS